MKRITRLVTVVAMMVVMVMASTSLAVAQGNPKVLEGGVLPVPKACDPGQGETSGTKRSTAPDKPDFGAVQGVEFGPGGTTCFVPLPEDALPEDEEEVPEF